MNFQCYFCSKNFKVFYNYKEHLKYHLNERPFSCSVCPQKPYHQYRHLLAHYNKNHPEQYEALLKQKKSDQKSKRTLNRCYFCLKTFKHHCQLLKHMQSHTLERGHKCEFLPCPNRYRDQNTKSFHMKHSCYFKKSRLKHEKKFSCYFCNSKVSSFPNLCHHVRQHTGEKPFKCLLCLKPFRRPGVLAYHDKLKHNLNKRWRCKFCDVQKITLPDLNRHIQSKHTKDNRCSKCYFCFRRLETITPGHMALHTKEKPYLCKYCPAEFGKAAQYYFHSLGHIGTPEYFKSKSVLAKFKNRCYFCNQPFINYSKVIVHMRKHTQERRGRKKEIEGLWKYLWRNVKNCRRRIQLIINGEKLEDNCESEGFFAMTT